MIAPFLTPWDADAFFFLLADQLLTPAVVLMLVCFCWGYGTRWLQGWAE